MSRLPGIDLARCAALVLMVIAHVAPSDGPARILLVSEFLTAPLFALLIGVGAQLGEEAGGPHRARRTLVRAACILLLGLLLEQSRAQVIIVLSHLAVLTAVCIPLARLRSRALAIVLPVVWLSAIALPILARTWPSQLVQLAGGSGPYRFAAMTAYALAGILLMRLLRRWEPGPGAALLSGAGALGLFAALVIAPNLLGLFPVHAYDGSAAETTGDLVGSCGVLLLCWGAAQLLSRTAGTRRVLALLAAPGAMSLTLYSGQILLLHLAAVASGDARDDSWAMLGLLLAAGGVVAALWRALAPRTVRERGPLEAVVTALERRAAGAPAVPHRP
ncbi:hypothetical protein [Brachybacterium hainanense]|uniref:DUF418 domain-containing protein n=1 Tax=Brachybacterium hainanense TaxID=1541174 RepID=A0ABV6RA71_9MICO